MKPRLSAFRPVNRWPAIHLSRISLPYSNPFPKRGASRTSGATSLNGVVQQSGYNAVHNCL